MGAEIISAIESGLGLMGKICQEFLTGFTTLFWVPAQTVGSETVAAHLSEFGVWSLVMLGVSITFAVVSLVLNIVRSNTGV